MRNFAVLLAIALIGASGCSYRYYVTDLKPLGEEQQGENRARREDKQIERSEIRFRKLLWREQVYPHPAAGQNLLQAGRLRRSPPARQRSRVQQRHPRCRRYLSHSRPRLA